MYLQVKPCRHNSGKTGRSRVIRKEKQFPLGLVAIMINILLPVISTRAGPPEKGGSQEMKQRKSCLICLICKMRNGKLILCYQEVKFGRDKLLRPFAALIL